MSLRSTSWILCLSLGLCACSDSSTEKAKVPYPTKEGPAESPSITQPAPEAPRIEPAVQEDPKERPEVAESPEEPGAQPLVSDEEQWERTLIQVKERLAGELAWALGMAEQSDAIKIQSQQLLREAELLQLKERVPSEPRTEEVEAAWRQLAKELGVEIGYLEFVPVVSHRPPLPERVEGRKTLRYTDNDIRDTIQVVVRLEGADQTVPGKLVEAIGQFKRLTVIRRIQSQPDGLLVNTEIFVFPAIARPKFVVDPKDLREELARWRILLPLEEAVARDPIGHLQNAALAARHFNTLLPAVREAVSFQGELLYLTQRNEFFRRKLDESKEFQL
jgi:Arc/MetJ family transcription regulator